MKNQTNKTSNIHIVPSTKGGVGKSNYATHILPLLTFLNPQNDNKNLKIFEIDDNNKSRVNFKDERIKIETFKINQADNVLFDLSSEVLADDNIITIIDCGGGNDSKAVLKYLNDNLFLGCNYYIPVLGGEDIKNVKDTIKEIRNSDNSAKITLVLNRVQILNTEEVKDEFWNIYGDDDIGEINHSLSLDVDNFQYVPNLNIFSKLSSLKMSLIDIYNGTNAKTPIIVEERVNWRKVSEQEYKTKFGLYKFGKKCVDGINSFLSYNKIKF